MAKKVTAKQLKSSKEQAIRIGGREYKISFNFGVLGELEEIYGDINKALTELQKGKVKALTNLMYAVMKQEEGNEDLTVRQVGKMLDMDFINELTGKMGKALIDGFGETEETSEEMGE